MEQREAQELFAELFGGEAEDLFTAAGRINVIGEHVDYCGGKVFPAALNLRCNVYGRKNGENVIRVAASDFKEVVTLDIGNLGAYKNLKWGNYQAGVAYYLAEKGTPIVGCDLLYDCTVPFGSGLSSSAAIEVATAVALSEYAGVKYDKVKLALVSQEAENKYAGVNCGIMDQFASAMGKKIMRFCWIAPRWNMNMCLLDWANIAWWSPTATSRTTSWRANIMYVATKWRRP